ncbi:Fc.00g012870.m01.CDS01 [Cosmosporella sp. VM-42]
MGDGGKRKGGPGGSGPPGKKSKGGNFGRWQTPHQKAKQAEQVEMGTKFSVGDAGIWVTYARGMKSKALREFRELCYGHGESLYGLKRPDAEGDEAKDDEDGGDIEASIQAELESLKKSQKPTTRQVFTPVGTGLECLFFMKTMEPVEPDRLVRIICQDAKACPDPMARKTKYINRLTPIFDTDKATENGIDRVARTVLNPWFELKPEAGDDTGKVVGPQADGEAASACTYAIRHNIRNHTAFRSDALIKKVAGLISPKHKVNLTKPDKVILVEIYQTYCGISVVDGMEWEGLKRYNVNELYKLGTEQKKPEEKTEEEKTEEKKPDAASEEAAAST